MRSQSAVHTKFFNFISCDKFTIHKNIHGFMSVPREAWAISEKTINESMPMFKSSSFGLPPLRVFMVTKNHQVNTKKLQSQVPLFACY